MDIYTMDYIVDYTDVDRYHDLTPEALMRIFGRVSTFHEVLGFRLKPGYMSEWNKTWILYQWKIQIKEPKQYAKKLKVQTLVDLKRDMYCYRYYLVEDLQGNEVARGVAQWVSVDLEKRKISRIPEPIRELISERSQMTEEVREKIQAIDVEAIRRTKFEFDFQVKIPVLYADIDSNMHVNNTVYAKWAIETLNAMDPEFLKKKYHSSFDIVYKKEKAPGGHIMSLVHQEGDTTWHEILDEHDNLLSLIRMTWTQKVQELGDFSDYSLEELR